MKNTSTIIDDQQRSPLINMTDDASNSSSTNEAVPNGTNQQPMNTGTKALSDDKCCCGLLQIQAASITIAILELIFLVYQVASTIWLYDKIDDEYAFAFTLTLFSFILAFIAVVLMIEGVRRKSPYFLVPHLLMQCAIIVSISLLCGYLILIWIGGTSINVDAIFYEDSPRGEFGVTQASRYPTIELNIFAHALNLTILIIFLLCIFFLFLQLWFVAVIRQCYRYLFKISEKTAIIPDNKIRI